MRLHGRIEKIEKQAQQLLLPTSDDLFYVIVEVCGEPTAEQMEAGDVNSWVKPYAAQVRAAWSARWPRWRETYQEITGEAPA